MPTDPKPPPREDIEDLVLGLFRWLRGQGHTSATAPVRARREIATALSAGRLKGPSKVIGTAFLVALETWLDLAALQLQVRYERQARKDLAGAIAERRQNAEQRSGALRLLQTFPIKRLSTLLERIADADAKRAARQGASNERQESIRNEWTECSELLAEALETLDAKLRAPLGVPVARTRKEWSRFEQRLVDNLRRAGLSYGEITKLHRPNARPTGANARKYRMERERVRGSARRSKSRGA